MYIKDGIKYIQTQYFNEIRQIMNIFLDFWIKLCYIPIWLTGTSISCAFLLTHMISLFDKGLEQSKPFYFYKGKNNVTHKTSWS